MTCESGQHVLVETTTSMDVAMCRRVWVCACGQTSTVKTDEFRCLTESERITA